MLTHFNPQLPIGIATDASNVGIGAVLFHRFPDGSERPIANVSKTLNDAQRRYSQIQREALAIIFGIQKFHQFVYGRKFVLITDHRPLLSIFSPSKNTPTLTTNRLARWSLILNQYNYDIEYRNTKLHANADVLSRLPVGKDEQFDQQQNEMNFSNVCSIEIISKQLNPFQANVIRKETMKDPTLSRVILFTREGWPTKKATPDLESFRKLKDSLSIEKDCLLYGMRIIIPTKLRDRILKLLHLGHFGISRMKQLARTVVYWPGINNDIEQLGQRCATCAEHQNKPPKAPDHPWTTPERPWTRVHIDHAVNFLGKNWLIVIDAYSRYPCILPTTSMTAKTTIDLLEIEFAHFGYPEMLVTDNAQTFCGEEFSDWCRERGIYHWTGAPYHPATNGLVERLIQTFKNSMRKSTLSQHRALQEFLLQYRRIPLDSGSSPSELLNGRQVRSRLDAVRPLTIAPTMRRPVNHHNKKQCKLFHEGDTCYALKGTTENRNSAQWVPAEVTSVCGPRRFRVTTPDGKSWTRHVEQLRPRPSPDTHPKAEVQSTSEDLDESTHESSEPMSEPDHQRLKSPWATESPRTTTNHQSVMNSFSPRRTASQVPTPRKPGRPPGRKETRPPMEPIRRSERLRQRHAETR